MFIQNPSHALMGSISPLFHFLPNLISYHSVPDPLSCSESLLSGLFLLQDILHGILFWHWVPSSTFSPQLQCHQLKRAFPLLVWGRSPLLPTLTACFFFLLALFHNFQVTCAFTSLRSVFYPRLSSRVGVMPVFFTTFSPAPKPVLAA